MRIEWTAKALSNLEEILSFIAEDRPGAAEKVAQKIQKSVSLLADQPGMGRLGRVAGTRELVIPGYPFILPYVEADGNIYILRVMHTSMKWPAAF